MRILQNGLLRFRDRFEGCFWSAWETKFEEIPLVEQFKDAQATTKQAAEVAIQARKAVHQAEITALEKEAQVAMACLRHEGHEALRRQSAAHEEQIHAIILDARGVIAEWRR